MILVHACMYQYLVHQSEYLAQRSKHLVQKSKYLIIVA